MPVTTPVLVPTAAIEASPVLQVPPAEASDNVVVAPVHTLIVPVMGGGFTVTVITA
jgi:hypothetical protein